MVLTERSRGLFSRGGATSARGSKEGGLTAAAKRGGKYMAGEGSTSYLRIASSDLLGSFLEIKKINKKRFYVL